MTEHFMYGVYCRTCGIQELPEAEYDRQMMLPDARWKCPNCGGTAEWDDDSFVTNPPEDELEPEFTSGDTCAECRDVVACVAHGGCKLEDPDA